MSKYTSRTIIKLSVCKPNLVVYLCSRGSLQAKLWFLSTEGKVSVYCGESFFTNKEKSNKISLSAKSDNVFCNCAANTRETHNLFIIIVHKVAIFAFKGCIRKGFVLGTTVNFLKRAWTFVMGIMKS